MVINSISQIFSSRLATLDHLLAAAETHVERADSLLANRLIEDMLPLGAQIAFTCNQPRNFSRWCSGQPPENLDARVDSFLIARGHISATQELLLRAAGDRTLLEQSVRFGIGDGYFAEVTGERYVHDFLIPNFYFHLVTSYNILRAAGVPLGKRDYMLHFVPYVQTEPNGE